MKDLRSLWTALPRGTRIALAGAGACLLAGAAVGATAAATGFPVASSSPSPAPSASPTPASASACQDFLAHLASDLGIGQSRLSAGQSTALNQTLADMVARGALTQAQSTRLKQQESKACAEAPALLARAEAQARISRLLRVGLADYAKALGISPATLRGDLKTGQTVAQVAQQQGMDEAAFRQKLLAVVKPQLDQALQAHQITQAQEDRVLNRIQSGNLPLWDRTPRSAPTASPAPTPST